MKRKMKQSKRPRNFKKPNMKWIASHLSRKIVVITIFILVFTFMAIGAATSYLASKYMNDNMEATMENEIANISDNVKLHFAEYLTIVDILSNDATTLNFIKEAYLAEHPKDIDRDEHYIEVVTTLGNLKTAYEGLTNIYVAIDSNNAVITDGGSIFKDKTDFDLYSRDWYKQTLENGKPTVSKPYKDFETNKYVITLASPIYMGNSIRGVIGIDLPADGVYDVIKDFENEQRKILVVDEAGNIVYCDNEGLKGLNLTLYNSTFSDQVYQEIMNEHLSLQDVNGNVVLSYREESTGWKTIFLYDQDMVLKTVMNVIGIILLVFAVLILGISFVLTLIIRFMLRDIPRINEQIKKVAGGDFSNEIQVRTSDEIGQIAKALNSMSDDLKDFIGKVQKASDSVSETSGLLAATTSETSLASQEITKTVEEIAKGMNEQASTVDECARLTDGLGNKVEVLYESSIEASKRVSTMTEASEQGVQAVTTLKQRTEYNNHAIDDIEVSINGLENNSLAIGSILDTITAIADQTNLLALNASIEAARAGEHGRGFAVVADEIRKLAEGSANAAKEIGEILLNIQRESKSTVDSMSKVKQSATEQTEAVTMVGGAFEQLNTIISGLNEQFAKNAEYTAALNEDKDHIIGSIQNISAVSEETAAASEEINASMEEQLAGINQVASEADNLSGATEQLNEQLNKFKI
ncbi:methyl-accepting chemotaxis protein [Vallitalea okinawensis]|uniref:methyl-accepting chemotaxis protein n=1 Tax=Vallitalea okinawensis TaxID=2078660 RepID=UPI000CFAA436|nr:methyl-accepting chemotaxis protein [Vallitalea okinawensis]